MSSTPARAIARIQTDRLVLTLPGEAAAPRVVAYLERNRAHFAPWSPPEPAGLYTEEYWRLRLANARADALAGHAFKLFVYDRERAEAGPVLGDVGLTSFVRGPFQACYLGYRIDREHEGRGLMREAVAAAVAYAFDTLRLHRVMANYVPTNERSARLLRSLGFVVEGYARDYLLIAGAWRDHVLTSCTNHALRPENVRSG